MPAHPVPNNRPLPVQPLLRRDAALLDPGNGDLRIALSASHVVTVVAAPPGLLEWLAGLDGTVGLAHATACAPLDAAAAGFLLGELDRAGMLADANHGRLFSRNEDEQRDALALAALARSTGAAARHRRRLARVGVSGGSRWTGPVGAALPSALIAVRTDPDEPVDLELIVADVFDPAGAKAASVAMAGPTPHLCVLISAVDAALLPPTIPGRTACRRCWALQRDQRGADWQSLLHPARRPAAPRLPTHHRAMVLGLIVEHTLEAIEGLRCPPQQCPQWQERYLDLRRGTVERRVVAPHPACGCARAAA